MTQPTIEQLQARLDALEAEMQRERPRWRWLRWSVLVACLGLPIGAWAFDPFAAFEEGDRILASEMNARFDAIATAIDGLEAKNANVDAEARLMMLEDVGADARLGALEGRIVFLPSEQPLVSHLSGANPEPEVVDISSHVSSGHHARFVVLRVRMCGKTKSASYVGTRYEFSLPADPQVRATARLEVAASGDSLSATGVCTNAQHIVPVDADEAFLLAKLTDAEVNSDQSEVYLQAYIR